MLSGIFAKSASEFCGINRGSIRGLSSNATHTTTLLAHWNMNEMSPLLPNQIQMVASETYRGRQQVISWARAGHLRRSISATDNGQWIKWTSSKYTRVRGRGQWTKQKSMVLSFCIVAHFVYETALRYHTRTGWTLESINRVFISCFVWCASNAVLMLSI